MSKWQVGFETGAYAWVTVEIDDNDPRLEDMDAHELAAELASEEGMPGLCAYCTGMGYGSNWSMDLGDWEPAEDESLPGGYDVRRIDGD